MQRESNYVAIRVITRLQIFMQIYIFINTIRKVERKQSYASATKYYEEQYILNILYIFAYYVYSVYLCNFCINS